MTVSSRSSLSKHYFLFITPKIKLTIKPSITNIIIPKTLRVIMMVLDRKVAVPTIAASSGSLLFML